MPAYGPYMSNLSWLRSHTVPAVREYRVKGSLRRVRLFRGVSASRNVSSVLGRRSNQARLPDGVWRWTPLRAWTHPDTTCPGQPAPNRGDLLWAHAEGVSEDMIWPAPASAPTPGAGAVTGDGALLCLLAKLSGEQSGRRVGTGAGVSGLWLLSGMRDDGVLAHHRYRAGIYALQAGLCRANSGRRVPG